MKILIINGPNLNLLGKREPDIYGNQSFDEFFLTLKERFNQVELSYFQSNSEGIIIDKIQECGFNHDGIILNAGAYTHYSNAIADAITSVKTPVVEVHISNIHSREEFRKHSCTAKNCVGVIAGLGLDGYRLAIEYFLNKH
ncbi:type II 3-dehydroquinate dehydratase [Bacteroidota bacterium]